MKLIMCEGAGEIAFLYAYFAAKGYKINFKAEELYKISREKKYLKNEIIEKVCILNIDGHKNLEKEAENFLKSSDKTLITAIGIFIDAELDFHGTSLRIKQVKEKLQKELLIKVHSYISPDNQNNGMIENLIMDISKDKNIVSFIEKKVYPDLETEVEKNGEKIKNPTKAKFMIYGATQNPMNGVAHFFLTKTGTMEKLDFNSNRIEEFNKFMKNLEILK